MKISLKICGIREPSNMLELAALKPDFLGFIFHKPSARDVSQTIGQMSFEAIPKDIQKVAVVVNKPLDEVIDLVQKYKFDCVQLHGNESPDYCGFMKEKVKLIKVFSVLDQLPGNLKEYEEVCDYFLFDTKGEKAGGNGVAFNHDILKSYDLKKPYFLSGGIAAEHAQLIPRMQLPGLFAVDINSRFETRPGHKDVKLVKYFKDKLKNSYAQYSEQ